jgi:ABC-type Fe3+/spermidine/putrescine transport system ATPase subunit
MTSKALLELRSVAKSYEGHTVLSGLTLALEDGEHTALLGPSGCGKSTALRLLAGLEAPSAGQVVLDDEVISEINRVHRPPHRLGVAMLFQDLALWPNLSVADNVQLGLAGARLSRAEARQRTEEALALCGIEGLRSRKPGRISGGEQQRVALARALAVRPRFLLLDEPFGGLDLLVKTRLLEEIARLAAGQKLTIVLVTHDPWEATALCRNAVVLGSTGRMEESGTLAYLLEKPRSEMLRMFKEHMRQATSSPGKVIG